MEKNWSFTNVWNESILQREERAVVARDRVWASELGKPVIDIILKMRGTKPTNPPNARSMRKFEAGNIWEWLVSLILKRAGILQENQKWLQFQYPDMVAVSGKLDFIAGGKPDYANAEKLLAQLELPEVFLRGGRAIINHLKTNYPDGMASKVLEIKSCSAFMFELYERNNKSSRNHRLQAFHYLKATGMERADVVYVSKDDSRMIELPLWLDSPLEEDYKAEIAKITHYYKSGEMPPKEKMLVFDEDTGRFSRNWGVEYSGYLTMLYGFEQPDDYFNKYAPIAERWNRVLGRIKAAKPMTEKNKAVIEEIRAEGFDIDALIAKFTPSQSDEVVKVAAD